MTQKLDGLQKVDNALLAIAVRGGDFDSVKKQLKLGADPNYVLNGRNMLEWALRYGEAKIATLLIEAGVSLHASFDDCSPLGLTVCNFSGENLSLLLNALLKAGVDINAQSRGKTALSKASELLNPQIVRTLIAAGADVNIVNTKTSRTPLQEVLEMCSIIGEQSDCTNETILALQGAERTQPLLQLCTVYVCNNIKTFTYKRLKETLPLELIVRIQARLNRPRPGTAHNRRMRRQDLLALKQQYQDVDSDISVNIK